MTATRMLVMAKAPVAGQVKTRLGTRVGDEAAARLAAAALLDTLAACEAAAGIAYCHLALAGDLAEGFAADELARQVAHWSVTDQYGDGLGERLARAHADVPGPVVQIGMDTPHVDAGQLRAVGAQLADADAVLGPAEDGGWWVLALRDPRAAAVLAEVEMSTDRTCTDTRAALERSGLRVTLGPTMRDVDRVEDAAAVAALAPSTRFAQVWTELVR